MEEKKKTDPSTTSLESNHPVPCPPSTTPRRLVLRIDAHLLPFVSILYLLAFLDRVNVGNARAFGLEHDLGLTGVQFNTALTIFFVPYILFEIPSNILLKRFSPRIWLSLCCVGFGVVTMVQGFVQNFSGLLATRFFLGLFECGMFPGCFYLLGMWYARAESQKRFSLFFSSTALAGAFGGLLASAIGKMDGIRGYRGWRWVFILEGLLTIVVGLIFCIGFPGFLEDAKWLTEDERTYLKAKLRDDQGDSAAEKQIMLKDVGKVMSDYKVWIGGIAYFALIVPAYGYAFFSPTILLTYKYSPIETQLRSVPPYAVAFVLSMIVATVSDFVRHRFLFVIGGLFIALAGLATLFDIHDNVNTQYGALFLTAMGLYTAMPVVIGWFNMNLVGHHKRAVGTAWQIGFGNIGGIISTYSFLPADAPLFKKGYAICMSFVCLGIAMSVLYAAAIVRENRKRDRSTKTVNLTKEEKTELGDLNHEFRYML